MEARKGKGRGLSLNVFDVAVHPEWFAPALGRLRVDHDGWRADLRVFAGGHAVLFSSGRARVTEWLVDPGGCSPPVPPAFRSPVHGEKDGRLLIGGTIEYQVAFEAERVGPEDFAHLCEELALEASPHRLFARRGGANRMAPPAVSLLRFEAVPRGLSVHAVHALPEGLVVVRSQALFEVTSNPCSPRN